jgi:WD40 repeat protein
LIFSPNDQTLVSANNDNDIRMWNSGSGQLVARTDDSTGPMFGGDFTSDGKLLIVGGLDEIVYVRDANTLAVVRQLKGQGEVIAQAVTSPDVRTLVTSGRDATDSRKPAKVLLWDLPSGKIKASVPSCAPGVCSGLFTRREMASAIAQGSADFNSRSAIACRQVSDLGVSLQIRHWIE